jgi:hypothetical protein
MACSNGLCIDLVVLPVPADEPHDGILVAGDVEHRARLSLRMLALPMYRFTSAGVAQSAPLAEYKQLEKG